MQQSLTLTAVRAWAKT